MANVINVPTNESFLIEFANRTNSAFSGLIMSLNRVTDLVFEQMNGVNLPAGRRSSMTLADKVAAANTSPNKAEIIKALTAYFTLRAALNGIYPDALPYRKSADNKVLSLSQDGQTIVIVDAV